MRLADTLRPPTVPTTVPAWTPLLAQAKGLVTDIGGVAAHGSIAAREYGIPAVMGAGNGTQRIVTGQRATVDGDAGTVTLAGWISRLESSQTPAAPGRVTWFMSIGRERA
ncbi:hypothetical protein KNN17_08890 [Arthrobacter bambusae]|nr:hypothetical protein [Arthrobacter bambusae]